MNKIVVFSRLLATIILMVIFGYMAIRIPFVDFHCCAFISVVLILFIESGLIILFLSAMLWALFELKELTN